MMKATFGPATDPKLIFSLISVGAITAVLVGIAVGWAAIKRWSPLG